MTFHFPLQTSFPLFIHSRTKNTYFFPYMWPTVRQLVYTQVAPLQTTYIGFGAQKLKNMSGFHAMSRDPWSLTFHILEMLLFDPSIPFGGYKLSHIQALKTIQHWDQRYSREISLHIESAFLCPWNSKLLVFIPQALPTLWWSTSLTPTCELAFVEDWSGGGT